MKRFRAAAAALMALVLLLASLPAYGAGAAAQGGNGAGDIPAGKMRIKNMWQNNYLYEASDGTVRYGMTNPGDESSHWEVEAAEGSYLIRNSKTGHYITSSETPQRRDALKARQVASPSASEQWLINPTATSGFMNIVSAADPSGKRAIHEEDQLGFAELSSDINLEFESPKWMLVPVDAVQIESRFHPGMVLYEYEGQIAGQDASVVGFGAKSDKDFNAQWFIEPGSVPGKVQIRNRETGHLIKQGPLEWAAMPAGDPDPAEPGLTDWLQESSADGLGYVTFANGKFDSYLLNAQFPDDRDARSNSWPGAKSNPSAQWRIASPSALQPVRIASYTDANSPTDYIYEEAGALKHGALVADPARAADYLWFVEDYDGTKRIRNSATGHYLTRSGGMLSALDAGFGTPESQWTLTLSDDYDDYQTIGAAGSLDSFVTGNSDGTVQAAADASSLGAQWQLVDPSLPADGADHYVRIQNGWQPFYLYETADGLLKYGNAKSGDDTSDQWLIRKHEGRKLFQNRQTGHYINISDMPDGHIQVSPLADLSSVDRSFVWTVRDTGGNSNLISSVTDKEPGKQPDKFVSLQNLTKYAEYGIINPGWGSPKWKFLAVAEDQQRLFRYKVNGSDSLYLKETQENGATVGMVTYGEADAGDYSAVWYSEDSGAPGKMLLKNQASGRYVALENIAGHESEDDPAESPETIANVNASWDSVKWSLQDVTVGDQVYTTFKSGWAGHYLIAGQSADGGGPAIRLSKAAGAGERPEALFTAEPVVLPPAEAPAGQLLRIKSAGGKGYLYENAGGVVLYGSPEETNSYSQWVIVKEEDGVKIRNAASGRFLTLNGDYSFLESKAAGSAEAPEASSWDVSRTADGGAWLIRSLYGSYSDELVHAGGGAGYAEHGLVADSLGTSRWIFEYPESGEIPSIDVPVNKNTSTPVQDNGGPVEISLAGDASKLLADTEGAAAYAPAGAGQASARWLVQDFNGRKLIRNASTGKYLAAGTDGSLALATDLHLPGAQWKLEEKLGYKQLRNADSGMYLEQGLKLGTEAGAGWRLDPVRSSVEYKGSDAFHGDGAYRFAVNAPVGDTYAVTVRYRYNGSEASAAGIDANGLDVQPFQLKSQAGSAEAAFKLKLRAGINTVSAEGLPSGASIDSLTVADSAAPAYRGATVNYISYEAEDAETNGEHIGPSRKYKELASEASGRKAVMLNKQGDYIEFKTAAEADSLVVRYSIPDSKDGSGDEQTLSLYVDGVFRQKLELTSKYAWEYGSYPWSNDPRQGSAHRFYDDIHVLIGDVPAGSTVRLEKAEGDEAASYTIDLVDLEKADAAYSMPEGFLAVTDFGAAANDGLDDTAALTAALAEAGKQGKGVWFPAGVFTFSDQVIDLQDAVIRGAGSWHTELDGARFYGHGGKVRVYDLLIDGGINVRDDEALDNAFHGAFGPGSVLQNIWIEHTKAGLWLTQPIGEKKRTDGLYMAGLRIRNLMADGINFAVGTSDSMMEQSDIRYPGDDGIAMWSFTDAKLADVNGTERTPSVNNTARFNTVSLPWLADNIVVFGGRDNKIQDNIAKDTIANGAGIAVSTRFSAEPFQGATVVERNTLIRTGSVDSGYGVNLGALWLYAGESDIGGDSRILVRGNNAYDSTYSGLIVHGGKSVQGVELADNVLDGAGTSGVEIASDMKGSLKVDNLIIRGERIQRVSNPAAPNFTFREVNAGFASDPKPFEVRLSDGQTGPFRLEPGSATTVQVLDKDGADVTAQAKISVSPQAVASFKEGRLAAVAAGEADLDVRVGEIHRAYTVQVVEPVTAEPTPTPTGSPTPTPTGSPTPTPTGSPTSTPTGSPTPTPAGTPTPTPTSTSIPSTGPIATPSLSPSPTAAPSASPGMGSQDGALQKAWTDKLFIVEVPAGSDGKVSFSAGALEEAAKRQPELVLQLVNGPVFITLKAREAVEFLHAQPSSDMPATALEFLLRQPDEAKARLATQAALAKGWKPQGTPVEFRIFLTSPSGRKAAEPSNWIRFAYSFSQAGMVNITDSAVIRYDELLNSAGYVPANLTASHQQETQLTARTSRNGIFMLAIRPSGISGLDGHWSARAVRSLASKGIVSGIPGAGFAPDKPVTRAELAAMLVRAFDLNLPEQEMAFKDVSAGSWYTDAVAAAAEAGLMKGYADSSFHPAARVTREELAVVLARALAHLRQGDAAVQTSAFADAGSISGWASDYVRQAAASGVMNGLPDGRFAPAQAASRAETAAALFRLLAGTGWMGQ
ncbi:S-layer homology domain-containing protein [Paenibacillus sp. D51F]